MIKTIEIQNLKGHQHTVLELSKGLNVIKGTSFSGKSSIPFAIKWNLLNRPSGIGFRTYSNSKNEVYSAIEFEEGTFSIRRKSNDLNVYEVPEGILEAIGTDVPEEVQNITRMSDLNIQLQTDDYFMLRESPGVVGKELNKIAGLEIINEVFQNCESLIHKTQTDLSYCEADIEESKEKLKRYVNLNIIEQLVNEVSKLIKEHETLLNRTDSLVFLTEEIRTETQHLNDLTEWLSIESKYNEISELILVYDNEEKRICNLDVLISNITEEKELIENLEEWLLIEKEHVSLKKRIDQYTTLKNKLVSLMNVCSDMRQIEKALKTHSTELEKQQKAYKTFLEKHKVCPLCGNKLVGE